MPEPVASSNQLTRDLAAYETAAALGPPPPPLPAHRLAGGPEGSNAWFAGAGCRGGCRAHPDVDQAIQ